MNDNNLLDNPSITSSSSPPMSSDSTNISAETIINNNNIDDNSNDNINNNINTKNSLENQSNAMLNSTNANNNNNNHNHNNNNDDINKNSLSNSQISIITKERKKINDNDINYDNHNSSQIMHNNNSNSHLYNIPDNLIIMHNQKNKGKNNSRHVLNDILEVSHNPKINNINNNNNNHKQHDNQHHDNGINNNASVSSSLTLIPTSKQNKINKPFPINIILGIIQLLLSCTLTALGGLILARSASFGYAFSGIWAGAICGIAGALGVINIRKIQTGFLAISLICVASSTLALALTGIGLVRDINLNTTKGEISAGAGLIFTLFIHFIISVLSVYYSAMRLCSRQTNESIINDAILENAILANNSSILSQERVENYIKSISSEQNLNGIPPNVIHKNMMRAGGNAINGNEKFDSLNSHEKLLALWLSQGKIKTIPTSHAIQNPSHHNNGQYGNGGHVHSHHNQHSHQQRPIVLVPAGYGNGYSPQPMMPLYQSSGSLPPPSIVYSTLSPASLPAMASGGTPPKSSQPTYHYNQFNQLNYPPEILEQYNRMHRASTTPSKRNQRRRQQYQHLHQQSLYHQKELLANSKPRRRKSDSEMENRKSSAAFIYTGLDRSIADSFLKQQEKINSNSVNNSINNGRNDQIGKLNTGDIAGDVAM